MKRLAILLCLIGAPAAAQTWTLVPSTPDISVSAGTTIDVVFTERSNNATIRNVEWVWIKNDCSDTLYFAVRPPHEAKSALDYPIRLGASETFSTVARVSSIGVSNDNASACTFTLQGKRR